MNVIKTMERENNMKYGRYCGQCINKKTCETEPNKNVLCCSDFKSIPHKKREKEIVTCEYYLDGVLKRTNIEKRIIYKDKKGRYIRCLKNKEYLDENNHWKFDLWTINETMPKRREKWMIENLI